MIVELKFSEKHGKRVDFFFNDEHVGYVKLSNESYEGFISISTRARALSSVIEWAMEGGRINRIIPRWDSLVLVAEIDDEKGKKLRALVSIPGNKISFWKKFYDLLGVTTVEDALERMAPDILVQKL